MVRRLLYLLLSALPVIGYGQTLQQHQLERTGGGLGHGEVFSPFKDNPKDSTKSDVDVPMEIHQWNVDRAFGEVRPINADTLQYMFQNWHLTEGPNGEYNFLGNMGTPRETRLFFNRPTNTTFDFLQPYDYFHITPDRFIFTDTKSPYTNLSYHSSGNQLDGDDRFKAYFSTNAGKHFGIGFLFDILYGRGRYDNQSTSLMNFALFSFYRSDKYNYHLLATRYNLKQAENGGITDDRYITRPEETEGGGSNMGTGDIPVRLYSTWNRNESHNIFFTHNYNWGFYREKAVSDSVNSEAKDSTATEFVPVARLAHTADVSYRLHEYIGYTRPSNYYADTFLPYDSVDNTRHLSIDNRVSLSLREGFRKWAFADIAAFVSHKYSRYHLPDSIVGKRVESIKSYDEQTLFVGGSIESRQWDFLKYRIEGETALLGDDLGAFSLDGKVDINLKLWKRDVNISAHAFIKNNRPSFYYRHFHSEHFWWDNNDLSNELKTRIEGKIEIPSWKTKVSVSFENIKNYTYIANNSILAPNGRDYLNRFNVAQDNGNIQVLSASLKQDLQFGIFNFNTELTFQHSSNEEVLPLPDFNAYANIFLKFRIAKVLNTEIGVDAWYFTSYYAPDYLPALGQFVQQNQANKVKIGNYPITSVYANFLLKQARFYVKYYHMNKGLGNMEYFLVPHHPITPAVLWFGISWNFYN